MYSDFHCCCEDYTHSSHVSFRLPVSTFCVFIIVFSGLQFYSVEYRLGFLFINSIWIFIALIMCVFLIHFEMFSDFDSINALLLFSITSSRMQINVYLLILYYVPHNDFYKIFFCLWNSLNCTFLFFIVSFHFVNSLQLCLIHHLIPLVFKNSYKKWIKNSYKNVCN